MILKKVKIKNYRLLKDFEMDLEQNLSLVIGKNNCGKTSLLSILEKTIGDRSTRNAFSFDDFNIEFKNDLKKMLELNVAEVDYPFMGLSLKLFISYDESDDLSNISKIMMDLDPDNKTVVLAFEYRMTYEQYLQLKLDFAAYKAKHLARLKVKQVANEPAPVQEEPGLTDLFAELANSLVEAPNNNGSAQANDDEANASSEGKIQDVCNYLNKHFKGHFTLFEKALEYNIDDPLHPFENDKNFIDLGKQKEKVNINKIINFKFIRAKREVSNKEPDKSLSSLSSRIYKKTEANEQELEAIEDFKDALTDTDLQLDGIYAKLFETVIGKVAQFGGITRGDSIIEIISTLQHRELLEGNTTVMYRHNEKDRLPEHYNGLGYMNLISMIFEIEILLQDFKKEKFEVPADINLLFIEEPEAHTHPQMQYVFIKNIKVLLDKGIQREDGENRKLQTIISTHSSLIVSESEFDDIKYFKRVGKVVVAKNLKDLVKEYEVGTKQYEFLKQYLIISRAELFFADKAILIEGDTERILLPTMMKKLDVEYERQCQLAGLVPDQLARLSQNISIIEVGAHSQIFEKFIDFLGIKSLIITDFDAIDSQDKACEVSAGVSYSNEALNFFLGGQTFAALRTLGHANKILKKALTWSVAADGDLCLAYQTEENSYHARSFEDAFIHLNRKFVTDHKSLFKAIQNAALLDDNNNNAYVLADRCIKKKTHFALDILYYSDAAFSNWNIPAYIKEGLLWLKK